MYNHEMIDVNDIKRLVHTRIYHNVNTNPMKFIRVLKDFDPYEIYMIGEHPYHFVRSFFVVCYNRSFNHYFKDFYNEYGTFDLDKLPVDMKREKDIVFYQKKVISYFGSIFYDSSEFLESLEMVDKYFKQQLLNDEIIEDLCFKIIDRGYQSDRKILEVLAAAMKHISVRGTNVSFEEHCQTFCTKYFDHGVSLDFMQCENGSEDRLALLYHCCRALINQVQSQSKTRPIM